MTFLKPLSAAIAIGTGGPFGAEGPIIATGGALGSLARPARSHVTADERKTLLAAGAAAGMAATFGSPVVGGAARDRAAALRVPPALAHPGRARERGRDGGAHARSSARAPVFAMPDARAAGAAPRSRSTSCIGALVGVAVGAASRAPSTRSRTRFEQLPIHWMWWPALGAVAVGVVGYFAPRTLGVGYDNIEHIVGGDARRRGALLCSAR